MASFVNEIQQGKRRAGIDDLKATIGRRKGLAPSNRFIVHFSFPRVANFETDIVGIVASSLTGNFNQRKDDTKFDGRDTSILCESCTIPGKSIQTITAPLKGYRQEVQYAAGYSTPPVTFSFHLTNDYYIKKIFDKWMNSIVDPQTYTTLYDADYKVDMIIQQLDQQNNVVFGVKLLNAFPTDVSDITLDASATDQPQKLSVTMSYEDVVSEGALSSVLTKTKSFFGKVSDTIESIRGLAGRIFG